MASGQRWQMARTELMLMGFKKGQAGGSAVDPMAVTRARMRPNDGPDGHGLGRGSLRDEVVGNGHQRRFQHIGRHQIVRRLRKVREDVGDLWRGAGMRPGVRRVASATSRAFVLHREHKEELKDTYPFGAAGDTVAETAKS